MAYPEMTGYIIPAMFEYLDAYEDENACLRSTRMLDRLLFIRFPVGAVQGVMVDSRPAVPATFNTGQVLLGLAAGVRKFVDEYAPYRELVGAARLATT